MARTFTALDLVALPRLDANDAAVLARSMDAAARDDKGKLIKLPDHVKEALNDVVEDGAALQEALGGVPASDPEVRAVDRIEDAAIAAVHDLARAWERLAEWLPQGKTGQALRRRLFGEGGLSFVNYKPLREWGMVETKLQTIDREGLDTQLGELGATPMLDFLRSTHARYGEVTGATAVLPSEDAPQVREKFDNLLDSLRHYVTVVAGLVNRRKPETRALADRLLKPLMEWEPTKAPRKPGKAGGEEGGGGDDGGASGDSGGGDGSSAGTPPTG